MGDVTNAEVSICDRLKSAREKTFGLRGRAAFARALGLSPTTYIYYEKGRVPPPDVLARAAEVAGVRLEWLITGQEPREKSVREIRNEWSAALPAELQAALDRFAEVAGPSGNSAAAMRALAETLAQVRDRFPPGRSHWQSQKLEQAEGMIPVLGRTAAGLVGSYAELLGERPAVTVADLAQKVLGLDVARKSAADLDTDDASLQSALPAAAAGSIALVQLREPLPSGVVEFVDAPAIRQKHPGAFALRVDGESMMPRFRHGDVVIAVAGREVRPGQAALVQIRGRVGVTLKLVRRESDAVYLVPLNERFETERLAAADIEWLAPVLFTVRF